MGTSPLAGFNELRARAADNAHELLILKKRAERLRRLHVPAPGCKYCAACVSGQGWPCQTRQILDGLNGDDWGEGPQ